MNKLTIDNIEVSGQKVFLRVDFNVPLDENQSILDDTRIRSALPTIKKLLERGARLIIVSHLGRPKGKPSPKLSLRPIAEKLKELLNQHVYFSPAILGPVAQTAIDNLKKGECLLMENIRFYAEETDNDHQFSKELASLVDCYVNDAFGTAHRAHASTVGVAKYIKNPACGYLMKKELDFLSQLLKSPARPFTAIIGGSKVKDKIRLILKLLDRADNILIGGGMAYTFLKVAGKTIGKSLFEEEYIALVKETMDYAQEKKKGLYLPQDHLVAQEFNNESHSMLVEENIPDDYMGLDIGPKTIEEYRKIIARSKTLFWNGPMGVFEMSKFNTGTFEIAKAMAINPGTTIVGGGDSVEAVNQINKASEMSHISTGGGASLEFLEGNLLPGVEALAELK